MTETPQQAYISKVHLKGYKSIRDLEIDFKPGLNIIIGPNGSGKTNFLEFLATHLLSFNEVEDYNCYSNIQFKTIKNSYEWILNSLINPNYPFEIELNVEEIVKKNGEILSSSEISHNFKNGKKIQYFIVVNKENAYCFHPTIIRFTNPEGLPFLDAKAEFTIDYDSVRGFKRPTSIRIPVGQRAYAFLEFEIIYPIFNEIVKKGSLNTITKEIFKENIIISKKVINPIRAYTLIEDIRLNEGFVFQKNRSNIFADYLFLEFYIGNRWLSWNQLSDGTKRLFNLISQISSSENNAFIEEPELGIHPDQLHKLMDFLIEQSKEKQIIITTHSPEVLNAIHPDELDRIIVTRYDAAKGTIMHKLTPEQAKEMGERVKEGDMFLSDRWVHLNLEDEIFNATKLNEK